MSNTDLTMAQRQLIADAKKHPQHIVNFYGIRETTKAKLIDVGLVETVLTLGDVEQIERRIQIQALCDDLKKILGDPTTPKYHTERAAREISRLTATLFGTQNVLTEKGLEVSL